MMYGLLPESNVNPTHFPSALFHTRKGSIPAGPKQRRRSSEAESTAFLFSVPSAPAPSLQPGRPEQEQEVRPCFHPADTPVGRYRACSEIADFLLMAWTSLFPILLRPAGTHPALPIPLLGTALLFFASEPIFYLRSLFTSPNLSQQEMKVNRARLTFQQPTVANWVFYPFLRFPCPGMSAHAAPLHISRWTFKGGRATPNRGMPPPFQPSSWSCAQNRHPTPLGNRPYGIISGRGCQACGPGQKSSRRALLCGCFIWFYRPRHSSGRRRLRSCSAASMVRSMASLSRFSVPFSTR